MPSSAWKKKSSGKVYSNDNVRNDPASRPAPSSAMGTPPTSTVFPYTTLFRSQGSGDHSRLRRGDERRQDPTDRPDARLPCRVLGRLQADPVGRSEEHTSELQSLAYLVCRLLLGKKNRRARSIRTTTSGTIRRPGPLRRPPWARRRRPPCFPTRRSSDLKDPATIRGFVEETKDGKTRPTDRTHDYPVEFWGDCKPTLSVDRKSTRLNSSH